MTDKPPRAKALAASFLMLGAALGFVALATPVSAHECISESHSGCASHSCPDDGEVHDHVHDVHWWRNHSCHSAPTCSASEDVAVVGDDAECQHVVVEVSNPLADVVPVDQLSPV